MLLRMTRSSASRIVSRGSASVIFSGTYDSSQCFITVLAWFKSMFEYMEIASNVTNLAFGGIFIWSISVLKVSEFFIHHGSCFITFCSITSSHLLSDSMAVPALATIGRSLIGVFWTSAVAQKWAMLFP